MTGYTGLVNRDAGPAAAPTLGTTATASSPAGAYAITVTGGSDPNYTFTRVAGTLTVTPAPLTATANNQSKVYGAGLPALTVGYTGLVNGVGFSFQVSIQAVMSAASSLTLSCDERWSFLVVSALNQRSTRFIHDP